MSKPTIFNIAINFIFLGILFPNKIIAQSNPLSNKQQIILHRDSLDFKEKKIAINTSGNEFSPLPFKDGLLFISNKALPGQKISFNKIYWTKDTGFNIVEEKLIKKSNGLSILKYIPSEKSDDFTAPTSNDNNILVNYKKSKYKSNNIELNFSNFSTDQAFAYEDSSKLLIYTKQSRQKIKGKKHWELWQAYLMGSKLKQSKKIQFEDKNADYLYPFIDNVESKLYFTSNKKGGKGGYDIYQIDLKDISKLNQPHTVENINTEFDEIAPSLNLGFFYFSSNKPNGIGGFDIYYLNSNMDKDIHNMGYPINTIKDELGFKNAGNDYFLTTNRFGNFDILGVKFEPISYRINGLLTFRSDNSLAPNRILTIKDVDAGVNIDTLITNSFANYSFLGKPNRNYEFTTLNGDSVLEKFSIQTNDNQQKFDFITMISGRSPKQIKDSLEFIVIAEKRKMDSIATMNFNNKFIVYYGFDKSSLTKMEIRVVDSLLERLKRDPNINVVIGAFTDCIGTYKYNYSLSVRRANFIVNYLIKNGLDKSRIISNGYSKQYSISPCDISYQKNNQKLNRRAEIVLSEDKNTNWVSLENLRGNNYYSIYSNQTVTTTTSKSKENIVITKNKMVKRDTIATVKAKPIVKKDTSLVKQPLIVKRDAITTVKAKPIVKKDTLLVKQPFIVKRDTIATVKAKPIVKKDTIKKDVILIAKTSSYNDDYEFGKEEILKALDSLATLKKEQERIIEYMTKRINKKPIDIFVSSDSVFIEIYDNAIHDKDSVSVIYNNRIIIDKQELKLRKPISFNLKVDKNKKLNELVLVAENLGSDPPNTAVMFVTEKSGRRQQVMLSTDMTHNEVIFFIRIGKQ